LPNESKPSKNPEESQFINASDVRKNVHANFAQGKTEFELRNQNQQQLKKQMKMSTTSPSLRTKIQKEQASEVYERLKEKKIEAFATLQKKQHLDSLTPQNKQAAQDIERQLIKLQRKCKHVFNKTTGKCDCCGKDRSTHI